MKEILNITEKKLRNSSINSEKFLFILLSNTRNDVQTFHISYIISVDEGNHRFWTSGTALMNDKHKFYWLSTGKQLEFTGWWGKEPNNEGNEQCLAAYFDQSNSKDTLGWNDLNCNLESHIICEKPLREGNTFSIKTIIQAKCQ